jgi:hypothetical protein
MMIRGSSTRWKNEISGMSLTVMGTLKTATQNWALAFRVTLFDLKLPVPSATEPLRDWCASPAWTWIVGAAQVARRLAVRIESRRSSEPAKSARGCSCAVRRSRRHSTLILAVASQCADAGALVQGIADRRALERGEVAPHRGLVGHLAARLVGGVDLAVATPLVLPGPNEGCSRACSRPGPASWSSRWPASSRAPSARPG